MQPDAEFPVRPGVQACNFVWVSVEKQSSFWNLRLQFPGSLNLKLQILVVGRAKQGPTTRGSYVECA